MHSSSESSESSLDSPSGPRLPSTLREEGESLARHAAAYRVAPKLPRFLHNRWIVLVLTALLVLGTVVVVRNARWSDPMVYQVANFDEVIIHYTITGPDDPTNQLIRVHGTIENELPPDLEFVEVHCRIHRSTGEVLEQHSIALRPPLPPGERRPFQLSLDSPWLQAQTTVALSIERALRSRAP